MFISFNWVREHCPLQTEDSPARIGERFSLATAEVEGVAIHGAGLDRFVAARVESVASIPRAKKLVRVAVDVGSGSPVTVVCGAPNVREGIVVPFARPGTDVQGKTLESATILGVESHGMLLSEAELGLSDDHSGLLELDPASPPGTPLSEIFAGAADIILEVDNKSLTHRPDLWGHYGIAREFATIYDTPLRRYPVDDAIASAPGDSGIRVRIDTGEASARCRRYCGLRIDGVRIGPSPAWLQQKLLAVGSRPINNVVDITNYVLFDLGQPLHAFDCRRLHGGQIRVRMSGEGEAMTLLDGRTIPLDREDLLIADGAGPVALAGVMGGDGSQIQDDTTSIFLESANFDPTSVRRSSLRHGRTDSSARFEKSLDPEQARFGILRAAALVLELCPEARVVGDLQDVGFTPPEPLVISTGPDFICRRLGCELSPQRVRKILEQLGFGVKETRSRARRDAGAPRWKVTVPSWRATRDISLDVDLVEEVGRIHGYDNIEAFAPQWPVTAPPPDERRQLERRIKTFLSVHGGLSEVFTYSMVGAAHCRTFGLDPDAHLKLTNAMSEDLDRLRRAIPPIHLEKARENQRYFDRFGFYEVGRVYLKDPARLREPELPVESTRVAGVLAFARKTEANFYYLRHLVLALVEWLGRGEGRAEPLEPDGSEPWVHPAVAATLRLGTGEAAVSAGRFYRVHPDTLGKVELKGDVLVFDLDFDALFEAPRREVNYRKLPRFPGVPFDVSVVAPERTPVRDMAGIIRSAGGTLLRDLEVFDVYRGEGIGEGEKSVAFHMVFRADDHTLGPEEAETLQKEVIRALETAGYPLRA